MENVQVHAQACGSGTTRVWHLHGIYYGYNAQLKAGGGDGGAYTKLVQVATAAARLL